MPVSWDGLVLVADDCSTRETRCALRPWHWSAGTPPRAWLLLPFACFAPPDSTSRMLLRAHTGVGGGARPAPARARRLSPSELRPRDRDRTRESEARAWRRRR